MKTKLTREESAHLISIGVPKEKASSHGFRKIPIFKLEDFLNGEILPKFINDDEPIIIEFSIIFEKWFTYYFSSEQGDCDKELINALYKLACWYYGKYLKQTKQ